MAIIKNAIIKKILKIVLWVICSLFALHIIIISFILIPPVQNKIISIISSTISKKWGCEISAKKIYISPNFNVIIEGFIIRDFHNNSMIYVDEATSKLRKVKLKPFGIYFYDINCVGADVNIVKYRDEQTVNIALWARKISSKEKKGGFIFNAKSITLKKSRFCYTNETEKSHTDKSDLMDFQYLELKDIEFESDNFTVKGPDISAKIKHLAFNQYTKFNLIHSNADFRITANELQYANATLETDKSKINLDLCFKYSDWSSYASFVDSVNIIADIKPSVIDMKDVSCWVNTLRGVDKVIFAKGKTSGNINNFNINNLQCNIDEKNCIKGDFHFVNITDYKDACYDINIKSSTINLSSLNQLNLPANKKITIPKQLLKFENANIDGCFKGYLNNFTTNFIISSNIGNCNLDMTLRSNNNNLEYSGTVESDFFDLHKFFDNNKFFGQASISVNFKGNSRTNDILHTANVDIDGKINNFDIIKYSVLPITLKGHAAKGDYNVVLNCNDPNLKFSADGTIEFINNEPMYTLNIKDFNINPKAIAGSLPMIDSSSASGIDKLFYIIQQNNSVFLDFESLELKLRGNNLDNFNGFFGIDNLNCNADNKTVQGERLRLTMINKVNEIHKYILSSSIINANLSTNYSVLSILDSLKKVGYEYLPYLININTHVENNAQNVTERTEQKQVRHSFLKFNAETFSTRSILSFFMPDLRIAPRSTVELLINNNEKDKLTINSARITYGQKIAVYNLFFEGNGTQTKTANINLTCDSIILPQKHKNINFSNISVTGALQDDTINYSLNWLNPLDLSKKSNFSNISGTVSCKENGNIKLFNTTSSLFIQDNIWKFNKDNEILIAPKSISFNNIKLESENRYIEANGLLSFDQNDNLKLGIHNIDLQMFNIFAQNINMKFSGNAFAHVNIRPWKNKRAITGNIFINDFLFNNETFGNLYLVVAVPNFASISFAGGFFHRNKALTETEIDSYNITAYKAEPYKLANIRGAFQTEKKTLKIDADIDTIGIGFLSPFLSSFSNLISGSAGGNLSFVANPDSLYFKGVVTIINGKIGISSLNTLYTLTNQTIDFDQSGIHFNNVIAKDIKGNKGILNGKVLHNKFKDFELSLQMKSDNIMILNIPKQTNFPFYGIGFISGAVSISGDMNKLTFRGKNLKTLPDTKLYLPITFSASESLTPGVIFKQNKALDLSAKAIKSTSNLEFDFLFDVTKDAEIQIDLDPSIGGTLNARVEGPLQINFDTGTDILNFEGILTVANGKFKLSFGDVILNANLALLQGGTIKFNGDIFSSTINITAINKTSVSLKNIIPNASTRRVLVNTYLQLTNKLMHPDINISFDIPEATADENTTLYNTLGLNEKGKAERQFASLLFFSQFDAQNVNSDQNSAVIDEGIAIGAGMEMLSKTINKLFQQFKYAELGVNIKPQTISMDAEYGFDAKIPLFNHKILFHTQFGYIDNVIDQNRKSNILGDIDVEYPINNNWELKFFYTNNPDYNAMIYNNISQQNSWGAAGASILYRQSFNNIKELLTTNKRKKIKK